MDRREYRINLRAAAWVQEIHRTPFHKDRKRQHNLRAWLDHSSKHRDAFPHALISWGRLKHLDRTNRVILNPFDARRAPRRGTRPEPYPQWWGAAAAVLLSVLAMSMLASRPVASGKYYFTRVGELLPVALGDGTSINLNSATRIAVETHGRFGEVHLLEGEAFFMGAAAVGLTAFGIELQRVLIWMTIEPISDSEDGARSLFANGSPRITAPLGGPSS